MYKLTKKAEIEIALSAWWFFVIFLIGGGIVIATSVYYSADLDIKWLEADLIANRLVDCVIINGHIDENIFSENNIYSQCNLDLNRFENNSNYFFKIWINDRVMIIGGDYSIEKNCEIKKQMVYTTKYFPICSEKNLVVLDKEGEVKKIKILAGSNQNGRVESEI